MAKDVESKHKKASKANRKSILDDQVGKIANKRTGNKKDSKNVNVKHKKKTKTSGNGGGNGGGGGGSASNYWIDELKKPIEAEVGLSDRERQQIYNLGRSQTQGATKAMMGEMSGLMTRRGFRAGESGIADTAIGKIAMQGQQQLGDYARQIAVEEAQNRFAQKAQLAQLNLSRLTGGGQLQLGFDQLAAQRAAQASAGRRAQEALKWEKNRWNRQFKWEKNKWNKSFQYGQERDTTGDMFNLMGMMYGQQQQRYAPYYGALGGY